jgi:SAM-dependent methyltransferase
MIDIRAAAAKYYDSQPDPFSGKDIDFYVRQIPKRDTDVLEIGCGTGRVTLPLSRYCRSILGIDISESMIDVFKGKLACESANYQNVKVKVQDACGFFSDEKYDLIIAPFRVYQNIENEDAIESFFASIRENLRKDGRCILNVFKPFATDAEGVRSKWEMMKQDRKLWEIEIQDSKVVCYDRITRVHPQKLICYPTLTYEVVENGRIIDKAELNISMRCYFPDEFIDIIEANGFKIDEKWGGYSLEEYGEGSELVVKFKNR